MSELLSISKYKIAAGDGMTIPKTAGFVQCLEATGSFKISFEGGEQADFEAGLGIKADFKEVRVENPGSSDLEVKLAFADAEIRDSRMTLNGAVAVACGGSAFTDRVQAISNNPEKLMDANASRSSAIIRAGESGLCLGDNSVVWHDPPTIAPGQFLTIAHKGEIWAVRQNAGDVNAGIYEETA